MLIDACHSGLDMASAIRLAMCFDMLFLTTKQASVKLTVWLWHAVLDNYTGFGQTDSDL